MDKTAGPLRWIFLGLWLGAAGAFTFFQSSHAQRIPIAGDEVFELFVSARRSSVKEILSECPGQCNPPPLNLLLLKGLDRWGEKINFLGFHPLVYYRLTGFAGAWVGAAGLLAFLPLLGRSRGRTASGLAFFLLLAALFSFFLSFYTLRFSYEMRAYAFWNGFWFCALAWVLRSRSFSKILSLPLTGLSLVTALGFFQIGALAGGTLLSRPRAVWVTLFRRLLRRWIVPILVSIYVLGLVQEWSQNFPAPQSAHFLRLWLQSPSVWILSPLGILFCFWRPRTRRHAAPLLAGFLLFLMGPLFFVLFRLIQYQITYRYFSYFLLTFPVYELTLAVCARHWRRETKQWRAVFLALAFVPSVAVFPALLRNVKAFVRESTRGPVVDRAAVVGFLHTNPAPALAPRTSRFSVEKYKR